MRLFIAEKSSLAEAVAKGVGRQNKTKPVKDGAIWTVGDDVAAPLRGHVYDTAPPDAYDEKFKKWVRSNGPCLPQQWKRVLDDGMAKQVREIHALMRQASVLVNCGDAEREGQLIVDEVIVEGGMDPFASNVKRFWCQSVADKDIDKALASLLSNADKRSLFDAGIARQRADWLVGMNLTRFFTILARENGCDVKLVSVGRVQSPTLGLIVDRDLENENFKPIDHYLPWIDCVHADGKFRATYVFPKDLPGCDERGNERILTDKAVAEAVAARVGGRADGKVVKSEDSPKTIRQPLGFSLTTLQQKCSSRHGWTANHTLEVAQSLYEKHKALSYPRTESEHFTMSLLEEAAEIIPHLAGVAALKSAADGADMKIKSDTWNDAKVGEHHAITVTTDFRPQMLDAMNADEKIVFLLVARTLIAQFHPPYGYLSSSVNVAFDDDVFEATGHVVRNLGWKVVFGAEGNEDDEQSGSKDAALPKVTLGDKVSAGAAGTDRKRTKPRPYFADGTLMQAMKSIHSTIDDKELKQKVKAADGIGTVATRAATLEDLIRHEYVERKGKVLKSTQLGRFVLSLIRSVTPDLASAITTARWESVLEGIKGGARTLDEFVTGMEKFVVRIMESTAMPVLDGIPKRSGPKPLPGTGDPCPKCAEGKLTTVMNPNTKTLFLTCDRYRTTKCDGKPPIPESQRVYGHGEPCPKCGAGRLETAISAKGTPYLRCACGHMQYPELPPELRMPGHGDKCPKCGKGTLTTRIKGDLRWLSCSAQKETKCDYVVWGEANENDRVEGHGSACPVCGKGRMLTRSSPKVEGKFLACDNKDGGCKHAIWPERKVAPLKGEGTPCPTCGKPRRTKGAKENRRILVCSDADCTQKAEFPEEGGWIKEKKGGDVKHGAGKYG